MQTYPGGIQSGLDYYMNDAGLLVCETTLAQTRFDITGLSVATRIRQTLQYADNIEKAAEILKESNNGLYTNEWLLADIKTNEIAMFELGTHRSKLYRSSKNEWYGGAEGFYWGCNNTKDLQVRLETIAAVEGRPAVAVFRPSERDKKWLALYDRHKGAIDEEFGKLAFTTPPVAAYHSLDAKFTTTDLARDLKTWALFGPPLGRPSRSASAIRKYGRWSAIRGQSCMPGRPRATRVRPLLSICRTRTTAAKSQRPRAPTGETPVPPLGLAVPPGGPASRRSPPGTERSCRTAMPTSGWRPDSPITSASPPWRTRGRNMRPAAS
jgi:hypothetical protein